MNKHAALSQTEFDALLASLAPRRDLAGEKYEAVRRMLTGTSNGGTVCRPRTAPTKPSIASRDAWPVENGYARGSDKLLSWRGPKRLARMAEAKRAKAVDDHSLSR